MNGGSQLMTPQLTKQEVQQAQRLAGFTTYLFTSNIPLHLSNLTIHYCVVFSVV